MAEHLLTVIQRSRHPGDPFERVVRWCSRCGAVVVDAVSDDRIYPGHIIAMRRPEAAGKVPPNGTPCWSDDRALSAQQPEAVAWTVVGPDGKTSIGGWHDMSSYEVMSKWGVLRGGHRYAYAYEVAQPQVAVSDAAVLRAARVIAKRAGEDFDNIGEFAQSIIMETQREAITAALRPDADS